VTALVANVVGRTYTFLVRTPWLVGIVLAGCKSGAFDAPAETDATGDTDTGDTDTGGDTGGDTGDTDTGGDTGDTDTGGPGDRDGRYVGTLDLTVVNGGLAGTCSSEIAFDVASTASPQIVGNSTCTIASFATTVTSTFAGDIAADPTAEGDVRMTIATWGTFTDAWAGTFDGDTFDGGFDGSGSGVSWEGTWTTSR
jgi:hypothetical protein